MGAVGIPFVLRFGCAEKPTTCLMVQRSIKSQQNSRLDLTKIYRQIFKNTERLSLYSLTVLQQGPLIHLSIFLQTPISFYV